MKKQIINISERAKENIIDLYNSNVGKFLRISLKKGGCVGMEYKFELIDEINDQDDELDFEGLKIYLEKAAILYLVGATLDHQTTDFSSKFVFDNPNVIQSCGCGESVKFGD